VAGTKIASIPCASVSQKYDPRMIENILQFSRNGRRVLIAFAVTQIVYVVMVGVTLPHLVGLSGGLEPFDMMPFGYDAEYAARFLGSLGAEGRNYYLTRQIPLDLLYPGLFAFSYASIWLWLLSKSSERYHWLQAGALLAVVAGACDYVENAFIASMLTGFPDISSSTVFLGNLFTVAKSMTTALFFILLILLAGYVGVQKLRSRKT
jgi:hypothetical protein